MVGNLFRKLFGAPPTFSSGETQRNVEKIRRVEAPKLPEFPSGFATEASPRHPDVNQDAFAIDAKRHLLMVADGVGGSMKGEIASGAARDAVAELGPALDEMIQDAREETGVSYLTLEQASRVMADHFSLLADRVKSASDAGMERNARPATTLMTAKIFETAPGKMAAVVKSVGDCQPMVLRADGTLERVDIAEDSLFAERVKRGELTEDEAYLIAESGSRADLMRSYLALQAELGNAPRGIADQIAETDRSFEQWDLVPPGIQGRAQELLKMYGRYYQGVRQERSVITEFVGGKSGDELAPGVHTAIVEMRPGDRLFLATDGIDVLKRGQIRSALSRGSTIEQQARFLMAAAAKANEGKGDRVKPDDITVIGLEVPRGAVRPGVRMESVGYEDDVAYAEGTLADRIQALADYRAAHPEIAHLARIDAGGSDPTERKKYIAAVNLYATEPGGIEGLRERLRPVVAEARAMQGRIDSMRDELSLAMARQQEFEAVRGAFADDPDSPVWRNRVSAAADRVKQLRRKLEMSRAEADVQGADSARRRAMSLAKSSGKQ